MDIQTENILRAVLRCAIASENNKTKRILDELPCIIMPSKTKSGLVVQQASVLSQSKYCGQGHTKYEFQNDRFSQSYRTINSYFYMTSNPVLKQAYKYFSINGNRVQEILNDRHKKSLKLFDEIYGQFAVLDYILARQKQSYNMDIEALNTEINHGVKARSFEKVDYDFRNLLGLIKEDITSYESRTYGEDAPKSNNTILNYLNVYTLCEYYLYRKKINDYYLANHNRPLYSFDASRLELLEEALSTQIYPSYENRDGREDKLFKNKAFENIYSTPLDHVEAKNILDDIYKNHREIFSEIPALLNSVLANTVAENGEVVTAPEFSFATVSAFPIEPLNPKSKKYNVVVTTQNVPVEMANKKEDSPIVRDYARFRAEKSEPKLKKHDIPNTNQLSLKLD